MISKNNNLKMIKTLKQKTYQRNKQNTIIKDTGWLQTATLSIQVSI